MKRCIIARLFFFLFFIPCGFLDAQVPAQPVVIASDSSETSIINKIQLSEIGTFYTNVAEQLTTAMETLSLVSGTYDTIINQVEAIELMSQGDYVSFIQGLQKQADAISGFSSVMTGLTSDTYANLRSPEFTASLEELAEGSDLLADSVYDTSDMLWETNTLMENTKSRMKTLDYLANQTDGGSLLAQLQLQNAGVQMMMAELADMKTIAIAGNNATLSAQDFQDFLARNEDELEDYLTEDNHGVFDSEVNAYDYRRAVFGDYK